MKTELAASHFQGVFPIMLVFLSFTDARIDLAERLTLQRDGTLTQGESSGGQPALRIVFRPAPGMPQAEVIYLQANLSDGALKSHPGILEWLRSRGRATGYLKAASYLMHTGGFTTIRDFLLGHSAAIVQDDSGIPLSVFRERDWRVINFGSYTTPLEIFTKYNQPALRSLYESGTAFSLPFGFGYRWHETDPRFDIRATPNEPNRFGWIVEVDPTDPAATPKKRTALGRFKHEGCETVVNKDGRVVIYSGDDERFDYVYKFVTKGTFNASDRTANMDLLDEGTLYVARFNADGTIDWLPLVHGEGPLTAANGFADQAGVLIAARLAGDALGATKMDRPEDIQPNPKTGRAYLMLTNNTKREAGQEDAANPRAKNAFGHIIEIIEPEGDFAATKSKWEILVKCGDPSVAEVGATFSAATSPDGWFGMPDNCTIDADGRLWVATDGNNKKATGRTDGLWAVDVEGEARGTSKLFFRVPIGAELCGPCFTPSSETLFLAVQHPGDDGLATFETPATRWPDFKDTMPTRPSVVVIEKQGGGKIG
jgi:secreted PhoX family phosphatase